MKAGDFWLKQLRQAVEIRNNLMKMLFPLFVLDLEEFERWNKLDCNWVTSYSLNRLRDCPLPLYLKEDSRN